MKRRFTEEQITKVVKRADAGEKPHDLCRETGVALQTFYAWKRKFGGMDVGDASE